MTPRWRRYSVFIHTVYTLYFSVMSKLCAPGRALTRGLYSEPSPPRVLGGVYRWGGLTSRPWGVNSRVTRARCQRGKPRASEMSNRSCSNETTPLRFSSTVTLETDTTRSG